MPSSRGTIILFNNYQNKRQNLMTLCGLLTRSSTNNLWYGTASTIGVKTIAYYTVPHTSAEYPTSPDYASPYIKPYFSSRYQTPDYPTARERAAFKNLTKQHLSLPYLRLPHQTKTVPYLTAPYH
jgi:hypothetical protein